MKKLITHSTVIPTQAGIQMVKKITRIAGQYISFVPLRENFSIAGFPPARE